MSGIGTVIAGPRIAQEFAPSLVAARSAQERPQPELPQATPSIARGEDRFESTGEADETAGDAGEPDNAPDAKADRGPDGEPLSDEEQAQLDQMRDRDSEVRTHEQAHIAAAGELFRGGPYYEYASGPDGKRYAVGGRVSIDTSPGQTPEETIQKAARIRAAAMAPAEPSSTDRSVAAKADRMAAEARQELAQQETEDEQPDEDVATASATNPAASETQQERVEPGALLDVLG
ncbi:MAG: putative metalloprotease CJM1_0395 family protein [Planctomycetota bacterium]